MYILILFVILVVLFCYSAWMEPNILRIRHMDIDACIPKEITMVQFSDTHFTPRTIESVGKRIEKKMRKLAPDLIIFSGDLIDDYSRYPEIKQRVEEILAGLIARYGCFAVYGNHDIGGGAKLVYEEIMQQGGFQVLCNDMQEIPELGIALFGLDDSIAGYENRQLVEHVMQPYQIAIVHEPDLCEQMELSSIDLMLSGHTHGGQIYLPLLCRNYLPKGGKRYRKGSYLIGSTRLVVSSGIGTTKLPLRFLNPPELLVYHLHPSHKL